MLEGDSFGAWKDSDAKASKGREKIRNKWESNVRKVVGAGGGSDRKGISFPFVTLTFFNSEVMSKTFHGNEQRW